MHNIGQMNILMETFAALVSIVVLVLLATGDDRKSKLNRLFMRIVMCNIAALLSDATAWGFEGGTSAHGIIITRAAMFSAYGLAYLMIPLLADYIFALIGRNVKTDRIIARVMYAIVLFAMILQLDNMYYAFDQDNKYRIQDMFWLSQAFVVLLLTIITVLVIRQRKSLGMNNTLFMLSYVFFPLLATIIQLATYKELEIIFIASTMSIVASYGGVQARQAKLLKDKELELAKSRISVMLSQIRPHFLYNSLAAIARLCDKDPALAKKATIDFSDYLRGNMDSLKETEPTWFEKELRHVNGFLSLEKVMYGKALNIVYDIKAKDFRLPVLTLQPIVENAVRHGIGKREGGGSVTISTLETDEAYLVVVSDDGLGFDGDKQPNNRHPRVGIQNVRQRLREQCGGALEIETLKGAGTTVTMKIPKMYGTEA